MMKTVLDCYCGHIFHLIVTSELQRGFFKDLWGELCNISVVHYTRLGSSIKWPTSNKEDKLCHVNWPVVYPKCSFKIMDPVSVALPQNLRRIFVATLTRTYLKQQRGLFLDVLEQPQVIHILTHQWAFRWPKTIIQLTVLTFSASHTKNTIYFWI